MAESRNEKIVELFRKKFGKMSNEEKIAYLRDLGLDEGASESTIIEAIRNRNRNKTGDMIRRAADDLKKSQVRPSELSSSFGKRDLSAPDHWITDVKNYRITKPTIICLPGNGAVNTKRTNGFCGVAERLMGLKPSGQDVSTTYGMIDVIGFTYGREKEEDTAGYITDEEVSKFVDQLFMPLCTDDNGNRLPLDQAIKNVSNITFFTHCHGALEITHLLGDFKNKLISMENGYSEAEVDKLFSYMSQVTYSPLRDETLVPTIRVDSMTDSFNEGLSRSFKDLYGYSLNGVDIKYDEPGKFRGANSCRRQPHDIISIYSSRRLNTEDNRDLSNIIDEHTIEYLDRDYSWTISEKSNGAVNADAVSVLTGYALSWLVSRSVLGHLSSEVLPKTPLNQELLPQMQQILDGYDKNLLTK